MTLRRAGKQDSSTGRGHKGVVAKVRPFATGKALASQGTGSAQTKSGVDCWGFDINVGGGAVATPP